MGASEGVYSEQGLGERRFSIITQAEDQRALGLSVKEYVKHS